MDVPDDRALDVNRHGVLRIPFELILAMGFLCRHWVLALMVTVSARKVKETQVLLGADFTWVVLALEIPALIFVGLCAMRHPSAGPWVRRAWRWAPGLALSTIALHVAYTVWYLVQSSYWLPWPELFLVSCALIDVAIGVAIIRPGHIRYVLSEFPEPPSKGTPP